MTDRERLALLICECCGDDPDNIGYVRGNDSRWKDYLGAADRILAALPGMGWRKSSGVTLKHDDQLTGRGADIVREWRPRSDAETTGGD